jgi:hypothetical protein
MIRSIFLADIPKVSPQDKQAAVKQQISVVTVFLMIFRGLNAFFQSDIKKIQNKQNIEKNKAVANNTVRYNSFFYRVNYQSIFYCSIKTTHFSHHFSNRIGP